MKDRDALSSAKGAEGTTFVLTGNRCALWLESL